jgi:hypothetical protein
MSHLTMAELEKLAPNVGFKAIFEKLGAKGLGEVHHPYCDLQNKWELLLDMVWIQGFFINFELFMYTHASDTATCKINGKLQRFSTADLYQFTTGTPSERFPFILRVAVSSIGFLCVQLYRLVLCVCACAHANVYAFLGKKLWKNLD